MLNFKPKQEDKMSSNQRKHNNQRRNNYDNQQHNKNQHQQQKRLQYQSKYNRNRSQNINKNNSNNSSNNNNNNNNRYNYSPNHPGQNRRNNNNYHNNQYNINNNNNLNKQTLKLKPTNNNNNTNRYNNNNYPQYNNNSNPNQSQHTRLPRNNSNANQNNNNSQHYNNGKHNNKQIPRGCRTNDTFSGRKRRKWPEQSDSDSEPVPTNKKRKMDFTMHQLKKLKSKAAELKTLKKQKNRRIKQLQLKQRTEMKDLIKTCDQSINDATENILTMIEEIEIPSTGSYCENCHKEDDELEECVGCEIKICCDCIELCGWCGTDFIDDGSHCPDCIKQQSCLTRQECGVNLCWMCMEKHWRHCMCCTNGGSDESSQLNSDSEGSSRQ